MGFKRVETVYDLIRYGIHLRAQCRGCGHVALIEPWGLLRRFGGKRDSRYIAAIAGRLRCRKCGARGAKCRPGG